MKGFDIGRFWTRWLIFTLLLAPSILRVLLLDDYGLLHIEVGVALALATGIAAGLAALTASATVMHAVTAALIVLMSISAIRTDFFPGMRLRLLLAALIPAVIVGILILRQNFYRLLAIFLAGAFVADLGKAVFTGSPALLPSASSAAASQKHNHVVHIVLDEMIGLAAMPPECADCTVARAGLEETFRRGNFRTYPYAFSNYGVTRDSLPSLLNAHLLDRCEEYFPDGDDDPVLNENAYFDHYLAKKYDIRVIQSNYILYSSDKYPSLVSSTYRVNSLKALHSMDLPWPARLKQILMIWFRSDQLWRNLWEGATPARFHFREMRVGPLALRKSWQHRIVSGIRHAKKDTLFFAHLLFPHYPYVYRPDGSIRNPAEWADASSVEQLSYDNPEQYRRMYSLYGQQAQFLNHQLAAFLDDLRETGQYDSTTILIHGDHGSRLRLVTAADRSSLAGAGAAPAGCHPLSYFTYESDPEPRDLRNRFATLLAIKPPGASQPETINEKGSLIRFLWKPLAPEVVQSSAAAIDSVYLFDRQGRPIAIPGAQLW